MTRLLAQRPLLAGILLASACLCFQLAGARNDVAFINTTTNLCVNGETYVPSGATVSAVTNNSAVVHWDSGPTPVVDVEGYEVLYWPSYTTSYNTVRVAAVSDETTLQHLRPYTRYSVAVRLYCRGGKVSMASSAVTFTTEAIAPGAAVTGLSAALVGELEANISWSPLQAQDWNGIPYRYYVYVFVYSQDSMCGGTFMELMIYPRYYNETTSIRIPINEHCYRVNVFPANHKAWGPESEPLYFTVTKLPQELTILAADDPQPTSTPPTPFLRSVYVYILLVAVVAVVPVVIGLAGCKKAREKKNKKVQYCRGIPSATFGDIQMYPLSPSSDSSAHLSPHAANSRIQAFSSLSPITPSRPLLSSPMPPHASDQPRDVFTLPPIHSPTTPKFLQGISPGEDGGGPPFAARTFTLDSAVASDVFVGVATGPPPPSGSGPHRPRANTEGGAMHMPNPYEFPVHPGGASTMPRSDNRSNSVSQGGGDIPPPPNHAPPPLTNSSLDIFSRHGGKDGHQNLPRPTGGAEYKQQGMSHRSFSSTHAGGGLSSPTSSVPSNSMRMVHSASQLRPVDEGAGPDYATVEPPDNSVLLGKSATLGHYPPPSHHHHHHHHHHHPIPNGSMRGMRNSDDLSSYSEITDDDSAQFSSGHGHVPAPYHPPRHPETGVYQVTEQQQQQRESVFSETSTEEPSLSSGSFQEASPSRALGWMDGADGKKRLSSSSVTPTNSRSSHAQLYHPPTSPS